MSHVYNYHPLVTLAGRHVSSLLPINAYITCLMSLQLPESAAQFSAVAMQINPEQGNKLIVS